MTLLNMKPPPAPDPWDALAEKIAAIVAQKLQEGEAPRLLTPEEAAKYLNRSPRWVRLKTASGELPAVKDGKARPRFDREALDRYIAETGR